MRQAIKVGFLTINQAKVFNQPLPNLSGIELDDAEVEKLKDGMNNP